MSFRNFQKFLYPGKEHSPESPEPNSKNGFSKKIEVFTIENRLQKCSSIYWIYVHADKIFCRRFSIVKTFQKPFLPFGYGDSGECSLPEYKNFCKFRKPKADFISSYREILNFDEKHFFWEFYKVKHDVHSGIGIM